MPDHAVKVITDQSAVTMTATVTGTGWTVERYSEAQVIVNVTAKSGSPTLDITAQTSADGVTYVTHSTMTQITGTGVSLKLLTNIGKWLRLVYTFGGSTSITLTSQIVLKT